MRTNIDIDDSLMSEALRSGAFATKREAVEAGLRLLAQRGRYRELLSLRGKLEWDDSSTPITSNASQSYALQEPRGEYKFTRNVSSAARSKSTK